MRPGNSQHLPNEILQSRNQVKNSVEMWCGFRMVRFMSWSALSSLESTTSLISPKPAFPVAACQSTRNGTIIQWKSRWGSSTAVTKCSHKSCSKGRKGAIAFFSWEPCEHHSGDRNAVVSFSWSPAGMFQETELTSCFHNRPWRPGVSFQAS